MEGFSPGILQEVGKGIKRRSLVTSLPKSSFWRKEKLQPSPRKLQYISSLELVWVSGCHKKKQEVDFDLLCLWVPGAGLEPAQPVMATGF